MVTALYALTGDLSEAQDVTQEAYARAWQRWGAVSGYENPEAWERTVARRIAYSGWRKARNRVRAYRRHGAAAPATAPSEDTVALVTALRELPLQRETIVLQYSGEPRPSYFAFTRQADLISEVRVGKAGSGGEELTRDLGIKAAARLCYATPTC